MHAHRMKGEAMPALQVRDFPQDLYDALKERAAQCHRSMAQQTIQAVEEMLARPICDGCAHWVPPRPARYEPPEVREARIAKRKDLFEQIEKFAKTLPDDLPSPEEMAREAREDLERRADIAIAAMEGRI